MTQGQIFKRILTGLNSEFSFSETSCLTKAEELSLSYHLPIAGGRIIGLIPFPRVVVLCEMQSVSSRIWTRIVVSNSYDDNHYTTGTSLDSFYWRFWINKLMACNILTHKNTHRYMWERERVCVRERERECVCVCVCVCVHVRVCGMLTLVLTHVWDTTDI